MYHLLFASLGEQGSLLYSTELEAFCRWDAKYVGDVGDNEEHASIVFYS